MEKASQKQAVIYCRVSTKEQAEEGNSLVSQEKHCREYAVKYGFDVAHVFIEEGESAKTADRTELKKLFTFCAAKKNAVSAVIAYKIDRISRNTDDYSQIRLYLKRYGIEIKSTTEYFEDTPAGRFMENIIANVAQFDNDVRAERCSGGMRDAVREGRYVWMAPYGYANVRVNGKATIAQNDKASLVKRAFELVSLKQHTIAAVREQLIAEGMWHTSGKPISKSQFHAMLKNELYAGWINKFKERHRGTFESIISDELFQYAQHALSKKQIRSATQKDHPDFPLRRFFRHPSGKVLTGAWSQGNVRKYPYYLIHNCNINIRKELLEDTFAKWLDSFKMDIDYFESLKKNALVKIGDRIRYHRQKENERETEIIKLKEKRITIFNKNVDGIISDEFAKEHLRVIDAKLYELQYLLTDKPEIEINIVRLLELVKAALLHPGELWKKSDFAEKIKLQWFYFPEGIEIEKTGSRTPKICNLFQGKIAKFQVKSCAVLSAGIEPAS